MKLRLRVKGILAFSVLVAYVGAMALILSLQRSNLLDTANELEKVHDLEYATGKASFAVANARLKIQEKFMEAFVEPVTVEELALDIELVEAGLAALRGANAEITDNAGRLSRALGELRAKPSRGGLLALREAEEQLGQQLDRLSLEVASKGDSLWERYRTIHDTMTVVSVTMGIFGVLVFGAIVILFFARLAWDIDRLQSRALEVVQGYRGPSLEVTRDDEVGSLMAAVNRMQSELRRHEQQQEIAREQRFHQDKMAAIGALASGIAHEINNPIAAISGIAESFRETDSASASQEARIRGADLILGQARRIGAITRQIAEYTAPHSAEPALLDLNSLVRNTCSFMGYDKRFRHISLAVETDHDLPAVEAVADHLNQILMNLLINAADALENCGDRAPAIRVWTCLENGYATVGVSDNGHGMEQAVLARAFEESFTTKPAGKGRGLGLFLSRTLIEQGGGRILIDSVPGTGTTVRVRLPIQPSGAG